VNHEEEEDRLVQLLQRVPEHERRAQDEGGDEDPELLDVDLPAADSV